jgi:hypothetical protein
MKRLYKLTFCSVLLAACIFFFKKREPTTITVGKDLVVPKEWLFINKNPQTPQKDVRPADQTFLTYPEWFLVFSPEEQANYFKHTTATSFPFMNHTKQIWQSYGIVKDQIKNNFPPNPGYHFMIWVIGSSASAEYSIKALYETLIGRLTDTETPITDEDKFNGSFTQDYVDFIKDEPWYKFDFKSQLDTLYFSTSFFGDHFFRKMDRRYILTSELLVKYVYGKLIGIGTGEIYDEALPTTTVILDNDSVVNLPRYDKFANAALAVAKQGRNFKEIAGNNSAIIISIINPSNDEPKLNNAQIVFKQPFASNISQERIVLAMPVAQLSNILLQLDENKMKVEHVFDY